MKIVLSGLYYPVAILRYFEAALQHCEDVELLTLGPYTGTYIPWSGGMDLPEKYALPPTIPLAKHLWGVRNMNPAFLYEDARLKDVDVWIQVDAGFYFQGKVPAKTMVHVATDPHCVSGDMLLSTEYGFVYPEETLNKSTCIMDREGKSHADRVIRTGMKVTRRIVVETGQELVCTDDHLVDTPDGWKRADEISVGDRVIMSCVPNSVIDEGTEKDYSVGFVVGAFQGDGSFGMRHSNIIKFTISKEKKVEFGEAIKQHVMNGFGVDTVTEGKHYSNENTTVLQIRRFGLTRFLESIGIKDGNVPLFIRKGSKQMIAGYIAGLLSADGHVQDGRVQITMKPEKLSKELQSILFYFGVPTNRREIITGKSSYKPGERYYTLFVRTGAGTQALYDLVGDIPDRPFRVETRGRGISSGSIQEFKVISVDGAVKNLPHKRVPEPVYDVVNTNRGHFLANGFSVHNCLEYSQQRIFADYFFNMQKFYSKPGDIYLPYCASKYHHYPMGLGKEYDVCLVGLQYSQRNELVAALRREGISVFYTLGLGPDEYREAYNKSRVAVSWSSLKDLIARVFEAGAMDLPLVCNRVPDLPLHFNHGEDYLGFDSVSEAVNHVKYLLAEPLWAQEMSTGLRTKVENFHTYDHRIQQIFDTIGV